MVLLSEEFFPEKAKEILTELQKMVPQKNK